MGDTYAETRKAATTAVDAIAWRALRRTLAALAIAAAFAAGACAAGSAYVPRGDCAGFPRIDVATPAGWCVGLVARGLRFPRGLEVLAGGDILVAEMGSWDPGRGRLSVLRKANRYARETLFARLDRPHGVAAAPDGWIYVGVAGGVFRFDPRAPASTREDVIGGGSGIPALPTNGRHPLVAFVFDSADGLYVSVGSQSDHCEDPQGNPPDPATPCPESEGADARGVIRRYTLRPAAGAAGAIYASGLRNGLALALHRATGTLLQGENARDGIDRSDASLSDEALPHDEINAIERVRHYGWPYCYDDNRPSPEFPGTDCRSRKAPALLLPPHAAPLGMTIDDDARLPAPFTGRLLVALHGYRANGHRILAYALDAAGMPRAEPLALVSGWEARRAPDARPRGTPVGVRIAPDGAVYVTEDINGTVLRVAKP
ncbi:MAG: sorbosone dehydrogenase family protein [Gammaproteobacteria bacterium]